MCFRAPEETISYIFYFQIAQTLIILDSIFFLSFILVGVFLSSKIKYIKY